MNLEAQNLSWTCPKNSPFVPHWPDPCRSFQTGSPMSKDTNRSRNLEIGPSVGAGRPKTWKNGSKTSIFSAFLMFFIVFLNKNGHNWATNGPIATFYGCIPFSFWWAIQKTTETWCRINLCGENACQTQTNEEKIHKDFIVFVTVFSRKEALRDSEETKKYGRWFQNILLSMEYAEQKRPRETNQCARQKLTLF